MYLDLSKLLLTTKSCRLRQLVLLLKLTWTAHNNSCTVLVTGSNGLGGPIPTEIGLLKDLVFLDFRELLPVDRKVVSTLFSPVSSQLMFVISCACSILLKEFNQLTGSIPSEIGLMTSLTGLVLSKLL
jgi:hypothetical protein